MKKAIINGKIIAIDKIIEDKILIYDDKIIDIVDKNTVLEETEIIDAKGNYVSPGFIDVHIHGAGGADTMDENKEAINTISEYISRNGVTSFLPTTMTMSKERIFEALENVREYMKMECKGAKVLGAHMEGPFINEAFKGAQAPDYIIPAKYDMVKDYLDVLKLITVAPEVNNNIEFIKEMNNKHKDISLSIGHSNASFEEAMEAIDSGIKSATHTFNAMTGLHHRNPGVVGAIFKSDIYCEVIADTIHVHPGLFSVLGDVKGKDKMILVTDAMKAACLKCGKYDLGGQDVFVDENSARLEDGTLAGSILKLNEALRNIKKNTNYDIPRVVQMATLNPATLIGEDKMRGSIENGKYADITIFDEEFNIKATIVEGKMCYKDITF